MNKWEVGSCYEELAAVYLQEKGYRVPKQNYRCRQREVDLICTQGLCLILVEVEYRIDGHMGGLLEAVDKRKQRRIHQAAARCIHSRGSAEDRACWLDVVRILGERVELVQDAFWICFVRR